MLPFDTCTPVGVTLIPRKYTPVFLGTAGEINKCDIISYDVGKYSKG